MSKNSKDAYEIIEMLGHHVSEFESQEEWFAFCSKNGKKGSQALRDRFDTEEEWLAFCSKNGKKGAQMQRDLYDTEEEWLAFCSKNGKKGVQTVRDRYDTEEEYSAYMKEKGFYEKIKCHLITGKLEEGKVKIDSLTKTYRSLADATKYLGLAKTSSIARSLKENSWYSVTAKIGNATGVFHEPSNKSYVEYNIFMEDGKAVKKLGKTGTVFKDRNAIGEEFAKSYNTVCIGFRNTGYFLAPNRRFVVTDTYYQDNKKPEPEEVKPALVAKKLTASDNDDYEEFDEKPVAASTNSKKPLAKKKAKKKAPAKKKAAAKNVSDNDDYEEFDEKPVAASTNSKKRPYPHSRSDSDPALTPAPKKVKTTKGKSKEVTRVIPHE